MVTPLSLPSRKGRKMKYIGLVLLLIFISFLQPTTPTSTSFDKSDLNLQELKSLLFKKERADRLLKAALPGYNVEDPLYAITVTVTSYNPLEAQCDDTPLIDSNNKLVMPGTVAIPQGFRKKIGIKLGQTILLEDLGLFTVTGHMNDRFEEQPKIDVISFIPKWSKRFGVREDVKMYWW